MVGAVAVVGALTTDARAQQLREAVGMAVQSHPMVASAKAEYRAAERGVDQAEAGLLPSLDLTGDSGYQHARRPASSSVNENLWRNKERLALKQLLYDGSQTTNLAESSKATAESAHFDVLSAATRIAQRAIHAYLDVVRDRKLVDFAVENINLHKRILGDVQEAARTGGGSEARVAQVQTRLYNAQSQRRRAEGNLANSISDFQEAVGQMPGTLEDNPMPKVAMPASVDEARDEALKNNPTFQAAVRTERAKSLTADSKRGSFFPTVDVELAHERRNGVDGVSGYESDSTALLTFSWNLYGGGGDEAALRKASEQSSAAMFRIHEVERRIRKELKVALNDYQVTGDQVKLLRKRVATAQQVTIAYQAQFRLGQRTLIELLDSGNELFLARTDLTTAEYRQMAAAYDFLAVEGTLLGDLGIAVSEAAPTKDR